MISELRVLARSRWLLSGLLLAGCGTLLGIEESRVQGACTSSEECAPGYDCLLGVCRDACTGDQECGVGSRCLKALGTSACIPDTERCGQGCPDGTACVADVCRTQCGGADDCATDQQCRGGFCEAPSDASTGGTGGTGGTSATPPSGGGGAGGGSGPSPEGGSPAEVCIANEGVCDGDKATTCNADGTGYVPGGVKCSLSQTCLAGSCETQECLPNTRFCSGNALRQCAADGLSSQQAEACSSSQYCDTQSATCKTGVCAPDQPACDGSRATTCNASGSGFVAAGKTCGTGTTCEAGECVAWVCPKPSTTYCQGQNVKSCSVNGLSSMVETTCTDQTCMESSGSAKCQGQCAPGQAKCTGNGLQLCDTNGDYAAATACGASKTCVASGKSASCKGECGPGQTKCSSGSDVQLCSANGDYGAAKSCAAATPFCYQNACTAVPPSCQGLAANCGSAANDSCCLSPLVTGGSFNRANQASYPATVSSFRLDKYEVTVSRFRKFIDALVTGWLPGAGAGKHAHLNAGAGLNNGAASGPAKEAGWNSAWNTYLPPAKASWDSAALLACDATYATWTPTVSLNENRPINCVTWYQSQAFCSWDGGFLPSEAEWNYAAAGGSRQNLFPWGATRPDLDANLVVYGCRYNGFGTCTGVKNIAPVGSVPAGNGYYGQADMAGNLIEWNLDYYGSYPVPCVDCADLTGPGAVVRNGAFNDGSSVDMDTTSRDTYSDRAYAVGFRCARAP